MKYYLSIYLDFLKNYKNEIFVIKFTITIIVNLWLLLIFWKIIIINGSELANNNLMLNKISDFLFPVLEIIGLNELSPNIIKMIIITLVILVINLLILYFNKMILLGISIWVAKYSYKSYTKFIINEEQISYMGFEKTQIVVDLVPRVPNPNKVFPISQVPQTPIEVPEVTTKVMENTVEAANTVNQNWIWVGLGVVIILCIGVIIYANGINHNVTSVNNNLSNINKNISTVANDSEIMINKTVIMNEKVDNFENILNKNIELSNNKIDLLETKVSDLQDFDKKLLSLINKTNANANNAHDYINYVDNKFFCVNDVHNVYVSDIISSSSFASLSKDTQAILKNVAEAPTTTEASIYAISKLWAIVKESFTRMETLEKKLALLDNVKNLEKVSSEIKKL
jgi:hypothetical protein